MAESNGDTSKGSPCGFTSFAASEDHHQSRAFAGGAQSRAALQGWLLMFLLGASTLLPGVKGTVSGTVASPSKAPTPGAKVTLVAAEGSQQSVTADQRGCYSFPSIEPATYTLSAEAAGYRAVMWGDVQVTEGSATIVDLLLPATTPPGPNLALSVQQQVSYYDDTQLEAARSIARSTRPGILHKRRTRNVC